MPQGDCLQGSTDSFLGAEHTLYIYDSITSDILRLPIAPLQVLWGGGGLWAAEVVNRRIISLGVVSIRTREAIADALFCRY